MTRRALRGLVLDYGGVLSHDQDEAAIGLMARCLAAEAGRFRDVYWKHRPFYDGGGGTGEYWRLVLADLADSGPPPDPSVIPELVRIDVDSWAHYRDPMWSLVREFRGSGGRTAFLSNNIPELMTRIRADRPLQDWFDVVVASCDVGVQKPERGIYEICLERLGLPAGECLFVDDREVNTRAARELGFRTLCFDAQGDGAAMAELRRELEEGGAGRPAP